MKKVQDYIEEIINQEYPNVPDERFTEANLTTVKRNLLRAQLERLVMVTEIEAFKAYRKSLLND